MSSVGNMFRYISYASILIAAIAQICPDGIPAAFECVKKGGQYKCTGDSTLGCEQINGVSYCCAVDPGKTPTTRIPKVVEREKNETGIEKETKGTKTTNNPDCYDKGPDCNRLKYLCTNSNYKDIMADQCPLICGICEDNGQETKEDNLDSECVDKGRDCARLKYLCNNAIYQDFMKNECPVTCKTC